MNSALKASIRVTARIGHVLPFGSSIVSGLEVYFAQVLGIGYVASMEEETRAALQCIRSAAPVVFDAGANRGEWTQNLLKALSPQAHIYAFDPAPTNVNELRKIADSRVTVVPVALGKAEGEATFYSPFPGSGSASLFDIQAYRAEPVEALAHETVRVTTLDAFVKQQGITSIDFMKMDMEGGEFFALEGGIETLKAGIIHALSFEFGPCNIMSKTYLLDFWRLLDGLSYRLYIIGPTGILTPVRAYSPRYEVLRHSNFIAMHDSNGTRLTSSHG